MSEYTFVEKPLLAQLAAMVWRVIDQGEGVPKNSAISLRGSFREVVLRDVFVTAVNAINTLPDGKSWLTEKQLEQSCIRMSPISARINCWRRIRNF